MRWTIAAVVVAFLLGYSVGLSPAEAQAPRRLFGTLAGAPKAVGMTGDALNVVCVP